MFVVALQLAAVEPASGKYSIGVLVENKLLGFRWVTFPNWAPDTHVANSNGILGSRL